MRVCLSMIVKNEAAVIERCLASVLPHIDAWAISDTGSTDGTQDVIRERLAHLPGELIERPWVDFATNRNEALDLARRHGDYALVVDADDVVEADPGFAFGALDAAAYMLEVVDAADTRYWRVALPRLDTGWRWRGVLHEALHAPEPLATPHLAGLRILRIFNDGARSRRPQSEKFADDAAVLRRALVAEPDNARYAFYLAQSLRDAGQPLEAIAAYERRIAMGGWAEEVYTSKLEIARIRERAGAAYAEVAAAWLDAYDFRPSRAEAPCELARWFRTHARHTLARDFARIACALPMTDDVLFIDRSVYDWRARDELAVAAYWCGDRALSATLCRDLLADARLPARERERVARNLSFAEGA
jgi:glycosyltransferase involved in cell wall biosynthesis